MAEEKPIVYILRGDDREAVEAHIRNFFSGLGEPDLAEMNTTRLEGKSATLNDLKEAALSLPFLTERRLVIFDDALTRYPAKENQKERQQFLELLDALPQTTGLVLIVPDYKKYKSKTRQWVWDTLQERHWLIQWASKADKRALIIDCLLPKLDQMRGWIFQKAAEFGGRFTQPAADTLVDYVGNNTQRAAQEIFKLLTYVNFERPVDDDDVRRLTEQDRERDVFELVDAIGNRDGKTALEMFHLLLEDMDFISLFGMIIRQFRLILQAREIMDEGGNVNDVASILHLLNFVAQKISAQARKFTLEDLEKIYHQLLKIDVDGKTGEMPADIAVDVLIAQLAI
ncbi:MAG: DNA polymerase III subunit delta [Anaerolineales bacterium]